MPKQSTGYIFKDKAIGKWGARITATDPSDKRRNIKRYCETKTEARIKLDALKRELSERGEQSIDGGKMKFREAAER
ncbi:MAG TPA: hypothetical protein VGB07_01620 [Blastocatellia bacterium]